MFVNCHVVRRPLRAGGAGDFVTAPHICTLFDVGPSYLVMELVEGETLAARLKHGPLLIQTAILYASQIERCALVAGMEGQQVEVVSCV
jgi:hypothetical protein